MKNNLALMLVIACVLAACGTTQPIIRYKNMSSLPPDSLLADCDVTAPPPQDAYKAASASEKERLLTETNIGLYKNIAQCNQDKAAGRSWKQKEQALIKEMEAKQQ